MKITSIDRLNKAFQKLGLSVSRENNLYKVFGPADSHTHLAEILLPEGYSLEKKAVQQLVNFASVKHPLGGSVQSAFATPDFHPGTVVPVGAVVATTKNMIVPQAIGTDIHCGMRLHTCDLTYEDFMQKKEQITQKLKGDLLFGTRDLPMRKKGFEALLQHGLLGWVDESAKQPLGQLKFSNFDQLLMDLNKIYEDGGGNGALKYAPDYLKEDKEHIRDNYLATMGGGNHFIEIQVVKEIFDKQLAFQWGIKIGHLAIMIHTGSRMVGAYVGNFWKDKAKALWPKNHKYPDSGIFPLYDSAAIEYLTAMNTASNYANLNRMLLAEIVRLRFREVFNQELEIPLVYDAPHNTITIEDDLFIHRKGATPAYEGQPVLIPGSMGQASYLMVGLGNERFLQSASHGAGRFFSRSQIFKKHQEGKDIGLGCVNCITLKEERKIEEAPMAYKEIEAVINTQVENKIVKAVCSLQPIMTFKG